MFRQSMFVSDICIVGAGPAGSTLASRVAGFGHRVCLIERAAFPRAHLGESLSPGVLPLLEVIGARDAVEAAGFYRGRDVRVRWDQGTQLRRDPRHEGLLVDRGRFDALLLDRAKKAGVRVLQPASVRERHWDEDGWRLRIEIDEGMVDLRTKFFADASGRAAAVPARKRRTGRHTLALYAYWRGRHLPEEPRIEAGEDAWYWGVPLPDGTYNTLVFVDAESLRSAPRVTITARFHQLIARSGLMEECEGASLASSVLAADATPYVDEECVTRCSIKVGDAALAIDPLSSSGVQKAIQNALAGAVVVNSLLRKPDWSAAAIRFFQESVATASDLHCRWAAEQYRKVARRGRMPFWHRRAAGAISPVPTVTPSGSLDERLRSEEVVELSPQLEFVELPCIDGEFVTMKSALRHPSLDAPVAFLGGREIAPLLKELRDGLTPAQLARSWTSRIPLESGLALVGWLIGHGILVQQALSTADERKAP